MLIRCSRAGVAAQPIPSVGDVSPRIETRWVPIMTNQSTLDFKSNLFAFNISYDISSWCFFHLDLLAELPKHLSQYEVLKKATRYPSSFQGLSVSYGHFLALIPENGQPVEPRLDEILSILCEDLNLNSDDLSFSPLPVEEVVSDSEPGLNLVRQVFGNLLTSQLTSHGFVKASSSRGVGRFFIPPHAEANSEIRWRLSFIDIEVVRLLDVGITVHQRGPSVSDLTPFVLLDSVTEIHGKRTLSQTIGTLLSKQDWSPSEGLGSRKEELMELIGRDQPRFKRVGTDNDSAEELYSLVDLTANLPDQLVSYKHFRNRPLSFILERLGYGHPSEGSLFAIVSVVRGDPNVTQVWPADILVQKIDTRALKDRDKSKAYKQFAKLEPKVKYSVVEQVLRDSGVIPTIISDNLIYQGETFVCPKPAIGTKYKARRYGEFPRLTEQGVERWGELRELFVIWGVSSRPDRRFRLFATELERTFQSIASKANVRAPKVTPLDRYSVNPREFTEKVANESSVALMVVGDKTSTYKQFKTVFTLKRDQAVQFCLVKTLRSMERRYPMLCETLARQILAKTGGLPFKLDPPILPNAIVVGLDRGRDTFGRRTSASAGVAAVLPTGEYLTGVSTTLDPYSHDFITVEKVAPPFLEELRRRKYHPEVAIILRDGSPATCRNEVPKWLEYLQEDDIELIFCASTKGHPYRIYPNFDRGVREYSFPIGVLNQPQTTRDFMVLTTQPPPRSGTPRPGLYTLMENTTQESDLAVQKTLLSVVSSMSILCWESPKPTSQPLPLHYADKLARFTQLTEQAWKPENPYPMFI